MRPQSCIITISSESYEKLEGYNPDADLNLGCGIPTDFARIKEGDNVLDLLAAAAGNDCIVARAIKLVKPGKVTRLDMTGRYDTESQGKL
ncbi:MAG: hypothetical protein U5K51_09880 [Flavobacteriaceae bacterium]|nr:hypothetical protein [Flavobacteriaceae bacterium]